MRPSMPKVVSSQTKHELELRRRPTKAVRIELTDQILSIPTKGDRQKMNARSTSGIKLGFVVCGALLMGVAYAVRHRRQSRRKRLGDHD